MEYVHSIIIIKNEQKYLNYYDKNWDTYLFPNEKENDIELIKSKYKTDNVKFLFDKIHEKYSVPNREMRKYHHYFYEVDCNNFEGDYFTLDELISKKDVKEKNEDIISFIREYYSKLDKNL